MDINSIINQLTGYATKAAQNIPIPNIPSLNIQLPNYSDIDQKWQEFLNQAAKDPGIVNYYNSLFNQAKGDFNLAVSMLQNDYQTGVRQTADNLRATLQQLGITSTQEQQGLQDTLNKRGIALTQQPGQQPTYAGGGQAATELGQLSDSQKLRNEAEVRSAQQGVTGLGQSLQKGLTSSGQQLQNTALQIQGQQEQAIGQEASQKYNAYQNQQIQKAQQASQDASLTASTGSSGSSGSNSSLYPTYKPNVVNQTVSMGGHTFKGNPNSDWTMVS